MGPETLLAISLVLQYSQWYSLAEWIVRIPQLTITQRASLIKLSRVQSSPSPTTSLYRILRKSLTPHQINMYSQFTENATLRAILLTCARNAPMLDVDIGTLRAESFIKEFQASQRIKNPRTLNYTIFDTGGHNLEYCYGVKPSPQHAQYIDQLLSTWYEDTCYSILYPKISYKTISQHTSRSLVYDLDLELNGGVTTADLAYYRHRVGYLEYGRTEIRQKFYPNQYTPRTYYAMGGDDFFNSSLLSKPLTDLCNRFTPTNRYHRIDPTRLLIPDGGYAFIYDLTSFTSNLSEHEYFLEYLTSRAYGYTVRIFDWKDGFTVVNMGELFERFLVSHQRPWFDTDRVLGAGGAFRHECAGMLGVYGNIATATFLHGISMFQTVDSLQQLNVAGDDGLACIRDTQEEPCLRILRTLGDLSMDKVFRTTDPYCVHLKRGIERRGDNHLYSYPNIILPTFEYSPEPYLDPRYPELERLSPTDKRGHAAQSLITFTDTCRRLPSTTVAESELRKGLYDLSFKTFRLPYEGFVPQLAPKGRWLLPRHDASMSEDPIVYTLDSLYRGTARVPLNRDIPLSHSLCDSDVIICNSHPWLSRMIALGHYQQESLYEEVSGLTGLLDLKQLYMGQRKHAVHRYSLVDSYSDIYSIKAYLYSRVYCVISDT